MNKESLISKRADVEAKFNVLQKQQTETTEELLKLQGEYRTLTELINSEVAPEGVPKKGK